MTNLPTSSTNPNAQQPAAAPGADVGRAKWPRRPLVVGIAAAVLGSAVGVGGYYYATVRRNDRQKLLFLAAEERSVSAPALSSGDAGLPGKVINASKKDLPVVSLPPRPVASELPPKADASRVDWEVSTGTSAVAKPPAGKEELKSSDTESDDEISGKLQVARDLFHDGRFEEAERAAKKVKFSALGTQLATAADRLLKEIAKAAANERLAATKNRRDKEKDAKAVVADKAIRRAQDLAEKGQDVEADRICRFVLSEYHGTPAIPKAQALLRTLSQKLAEQEQKQVQKQENVGQRDGEVTTSQTRKLERPEAGGDRAFLEMDRERTVDLRAAKAEAARQRATQFPADVRTTYQRTPKPVDTQRTVVDEAAAQRLDAAAQAARQRLTERKARETYVKPAKPANGERNYLGQTGGDEHHGDAGAIREHEPGQKVLIQAAPEKTP